jgi:Domain of unknown function (DUF4185)
MMGSLWLMPVLLAMTGEPAPAVPFELTEAQPLPALTRLFHQTEGWTGADSAASIRLGPERTLWLFADTWIGKIESGRRVGPKLINNSVAWQPLKVDKPELRFFWDQAGKQPAALLRPTEPDAWYWPGDGVLVDGQLYLFCKLVRKKAEGEPGFQFDWFANELVQISNPQEEPTAWKVKRRRLPEGKNSLRLGSACVLEGDYLLVYGLFPIAACKPLDKPLAVARVHRKKLADLDNTAWEYWCTGPQGERWNDKLEDPAPLFRDAAPEMTVNRIRGVEGLLATYTSLGLSKEILVRHALKPEGPWSPPLCVYRCPDAGDKVFFYGAKAHPELSVRDGQVVITYCRNCGDLGEHVRRPEVYFPQGVEVQLRPR